MNLKQFLILSTIMFSYSSTQIISQEKETKNNKMLIRYVKRGILLKVGELLHKKADIMIKNNEGRSLMELTTDSDVLKLLKEHKELRDKSLINAVRSKNIAQVRELLKSKNYNERSNIYGVNALMYATEEGLVSITNLLLKYEPTLINEQDDAGLTALMIATQYAQEKIIDILLTQKAIIDLKTKDGESALSIAENQLKMAKNIKNTHKQIIYEKIIDKFLAYDRTLLLRSKIPKVSEPESKSIEDDGFELINLSELNYIKKNDNNWVKL